MKEPTYLRHECPNCKSKKLNKRYGYEEGVYRCLNCYKTTVVPV